jgi:hypothetical protein
MRTLRSMPDTSSTDDTPPMINPPPPDQIDPTDWATTPPAVQAHVQDLHAQRRAFQDQILKLKARQKSITNRRDYISALAVIVAAAVAALITATITQKNDVSQVGTRVETPVPSTQLVSTSPTALTPTTVPQPTVPFMLVQATVTALAKDAVQVYGPIDGELEHGEEGLYTSEGANIQLRNFIAEVRFHNPYDRSERGWDYGLLFRNTGGNEQYRLYVNSDETWGFRLRNNDEEKILATTILEHLKTGATDTNLLRLVVKDNEAFFFLNDNYVSTLDVSDRTIPGLVLVVGGLGQAHQITGKVTRYEDFTIWRLP